MCALAKHGMATLIRSPISKRLCQTTSTLNLHNSMGAASFYLETTQTASNSCREHALCCHSQFYSWRCVGSSLWAPSWKPQIRLLDNRQNCNTRRRYIFRSLRLCAKTAPKTRPRSRLRLIPGMASERGAFWTFHQAKALAIILQGVSI